jgi:hypothetical protein
MFGAGGRNSPRGVSSISCFGYSAIDAEMEREEASMPKKRNNEC